MPDPIFLGDLISFFTLAPVLLFVTVGFFGAILFFVALVVTSFSPFLGELFD